MGFYYQLPQIVFEKLVDIFALMDIIDNVHPMQNRIQFMEIVYFINHGNLHV
jgi:hypothetical protein